MPFKTVAIAGFGTLGKPIVDALLAASITPIILSRGSSKSGLPPSVKVLSTGYTDKVAVTAALKEHKVEVVISILGRDAWDLQVGLAEAAKDAGVKLFFPSEFGFPTAGHTEGILSHKNILAPQISEFVPTVRIFTGLFDEWVPFLSTTSKYPGKVVFVKGSTATVKASFTSVVDIGGFIAHILSTLSVSELGSKILRLQGESLSFQDIATLYGKELVYVEKEEFGHEVVPLLQEVVSNGWGSTGYDHQKALDGEESEAVEKRAGEANKLWEGHTFLTLKEVLKEF